jgi:hypothetical protein
MIISGAEPVMIIMKDTATALDSGMTEFRIWAVVYDILDLSEYSIEDLTLLPMIPHLTLI